MQWPSTYRFDVHKRWYGQAALAPSMPLQAQSINTWSAVIPPACPAAAAITGIARQ
jgi:hypothetical protein